MPVMNGYEVCREKKKHQATVNIPVIFLSGHGDLPSMVQGYESGAEGYLVKPFREDILRSKVKAMAGMKKKHEETANKVDVLRKSVSEATDIALAALNATGDAGLLISFIEQA